LAKAALEVASFPPPKGGGNLNSQLGVEYMSTQPEDDSDLFDGFENGSLHICVDHIYINLDFHLWDWEALFRDALGAYCWNQPPEGLYPEDHDESERRKFIDSLSEFPRLRTIYDMYEDYRFSLEETNELRAECIEVKARVIDEAALKAVRKLIYGCDLAIKTKGDLMFSCD
jgi:hypothetical protein